MFTRLRDWSFVYVLCVHVDLGNLFATGALCLHLISFTSTSVNHKMKENGVQNGGL